MVTRVSGSPGPCREIHDTKNLSTVNGPNSWIFQGLVPTHLRMTCASSPLAGVPTENLEIKLWPIDRPVYPPLFYPTPSLWSPRTLTDARLGNPRRNPGAVFPRGRADCVTEDATLPPRPPRPPPFAAAAATAAMLVHSKNLPVGDA